MNYFKNYRNSLTILFLFNFLLSFSDSLENLSDQDYITGEDGTLRMYVNIIGNVNNPGTFLLYDGIDFMTALSAAGGIKDGSNLKKIYVLNKNGTKTHIDLYDYFYGKGGLKKIVLKPHDTIIVNQKIISHILTSSNLPQIFLAILNVALTLERTSD